MARRDPTAEILKELAVLRRDPRSAAALSLLRRALSDKANIVVERAAELVAEGGYGNLVPDLCEAFARLVEDPERDRGCNGKVAIVMALARLDKGGDEVPVAATRYVQMEFALGGSQDTAPELRAVAAVALAEKDHSQAVECAIRLLVDPETRARVGGIRALVANASETAAMLLRYKALVPEREAEVVEQCFRGLLSIDKTATSFVAEYLEVEDDEVIGIAAVALGESGRAEALPFLRSAWEKQRGAYAGPTILLAIAMLRLDEGIDLLIDLIRDGDSRYAQASLAALSLYRSEERVRERVEDAVRDSGSRAVLDAYRSVFV